MATALIGCPCSRLFPRATFSSRNLQEVRVFSRTRPIDSQGTVLSRRSAGRGVRVKNATVSVSTTATATQVRVQDFLEQAQSFGKVHLYVNSHTYQYKTRTNMEHIFYNDADEEAWDACLCHNDGAWEFKFYVGRVAVAAFKEDTVLGVPLYIIQFIDKTGLISFSLTLMADPQTQEYDPEQVRAYKALMKDYGPRVKFSNKV